MMKFKANNLLNNIKQSSPEGKAEEVEIEMTDFAPGSPVAGSPF
jgi:hypothetical protein